MKLFDDLKMNKVISNLTLCVAKCDNGNVMLYAGNSNGKVLLKRFKGYHQYERFLVRSVILGMTGKYDVKAVDKIYSALKDTVDSLSEYTSDNIGF